MSVFSFVCCSSKMSTDSRALLPKEVLAMNERHQNVWADSEHLVMVDEEVGH
jgi:hypothetical protein